MEKSCSIHPNNKNEINCGICEKRFCSLCLSEENGTILCSNHREIYLKGPWVKSIIITCSEEAPELGLSLYQFKEFLWESKEIPTYLSFKYSYSKNSFFTTMELNSLSKDLSIIKSIWTEKVNCP